MKRKALTIGIILLFIGTCLIPAMAQDTEKPQPIVRGNWLYVGGSGPGNYSKIQDAINASSDEDTVFVYDDSSPYYENILINKKIHLLGESKNSTVIDGRENGDVIQIYADNVSICELKIQNSSLYPQTPGGYGMLLDSCSNCTVKNNIVIHTSYGIRLPKNSHFNLVSDNNILENQDMGIGIWVGTFGEYSVGNNKIINNTIYDSFTGINVDYSSENEIRENTMKNMNEGIIITCSEQTSIFGNHAEKIINYGIRLSLSNNSIVTKNRVENITDSGILLLASSNCVISENEIKNNTYGFCLIDYSEFNTVFGNNIVNNTHGIFTVFNSSKNQIYHNNFINNLEPVDDEYNNTWNNEYPSCGNYWESYTGNDTFWGQNQTINGSDGVGDTPYDIASGDNKDMYPLMKPYDMTTLSIDFRGGLFRYSGIITNIGNTTAFNVSWDIEVQGSFVFIGKKSWGNLQKPLLAGEETQVPSRFLLGFGSIIITMAIWADNAPYASKSIPGKLLLFFIKI